MVAVKLAVVSLIVAVGVFYIDPQNWQPFAPYGYSGISFFGKTIAGQQGRRRASWSHGGRGNRLLRLHRL